MDLISVAIITGGLLLYSLVSGRIHGTIVTAPMVFVVFGLGLDATGSDLGSFDVGHSAIHLIAEFTLIVVLFTDAARIDLNWVRRDHSLPVCKLIIGLPLAITAGAFIATRLFPVLSFWEAALLAALLAPTNAALGQSVVSRGAGFVAFSDKCYN